MCVCVLGPASTNDASRRVVRSLPVNVDVTAAGEASHMTARGKGLTEATVNQPTWFSVDASRAGKQREWCSVIG